MVSNHAQRRRSPLRLRFGAGLNAALVVCAAAGPTTVTPADYGAAIGLNGVVYFASGDGELHAVDIGTGELNWTRALEGAPAGRPAGNRL